MADQNKAVSDDIVKEAIEQFETSQAGSTDNRSSYAEDVEFARVANQWPEKIKTQRIQEGRPVLTINKLPPLIRAVVNESRQNKPAIQVSPVDNGADEDSAQVIGGLIRSIERNSNASVAYDTAIDCSVTGGFGFFRVGIDYTHPDSFAMKATIDRIPNALSVHWDVSSTGFDSSDWEYAFISDFMNKEEYERLYPGASMVAFDGGGTSSGEVLEGHHWMNDDEIRVAEYFRRVVNERKILQIVLTNPQTQQPEFQVIREDQLPIMAKAFFEKGGIDMEGIGGSDEQLAQAFIAAAGIEVRKERMAEYYTVERRMINGIEELEKDDWPGSTIPICPVWGDEVFHDGKRMFKSMIRDASDPQRMFNFWRSASTELVALAPKAPWVGPKGFIPKGQEDKWNSANTRSHAYLEYEPSSGAPIRTPFAGVPAGALQEAMNANDDMKAITGIYDPSLGAEAPEKSGVAIRARQHQGDVSNFHFLDNLNRAIQSAGRIIVEIIPAIYSPEETLRILGEDQKEEVVQLTQQEGGATQKNEDGSQRLYNLSVGIYDVTVSSGPSFSTQREETRDTLIEIMRQVPDAAPYLGDVLLNHMDFVGADKISKRLAHLLPPEIRNAEAEEGAEDNPEAKEALQQLKAFQQQAEQLKQQALQEIERLTKENESLKADTQGKAQKANNDAQLHVAEMDLKAKEVELSTIEAQVRLAELQKPPEDVVTPEEQWQYDRENMADEQLFKEEQAALDRQLELAKTIIAADSKDGDGVKTQDNSVAMAEAMERAAAMLAAPKAVIRDPLTNQVVGVETVLDG